MLNLLRWAPEIIKPTSTATATATVTAMDKATATDQGTAKIFAIMEWLPIVQLNILEGAARYAGLLLAPAEGFAQGQGFFCPLGKILFFILFWPTFW